MRLKDQLSRQPSCRCRRTRFVAAWLWVALAPVGCVSQRPLQVVVAPEPADHAWWLRTSFVARGNQVRGIPARQLDPAWCHAGELSAQAFPEEARSGRDGLARHFGDSGGGFSASDVFAGRRLDLVLGIAGTCSGESATFLLVLDSSQAAGSPARVVQVQPVASPAAMTYLTTDAPRQAIYVPSCFQCDHVGEWRWDALQQRFVARPEPVFGE